MTQYENEDMTQISIEILNRLGIKFKQDKNQQMIKCINDEHNDHHASMSLNLSKGLCNCFACGYSKRLTNVYYEKTGSSIYKDMGLNRPTRRLGFTGRHVPDYITFEKLPEIDFTFDGQLYSVRDSKDAMNWAEKRGFSATFCEVNNIRFSPQFKTFQTSDPNNKEEMSFFHNCVVIPIFEKNKLISFEARDTLGKEAWKKHLQEMGVKDIDEKKYRKVLYPKHSSVNTLFQYEKLDTSQRLYITEGLMDMLSLRTDQNFKNSSCMFHCNPTERQIYLLKKFKEIVYVVDNDIPGWKACLKLMEAIPGKVFFLRPPERPGVKDINDILQGKDKVLHSVKDLVDHGWLRKISNDPTVLNLLIEDKTKHLN